MASLPSRRKVERALADASHAARSLIKEANRAAGRLVSHGDYARSERLIALAKAIGAFEGEIHKLREQLQSVANHWPTASSCGSLAVMERTLCVTATSKSICF